MVLGYENGKAVVLDTVKNCVLKEWHVAQSCIQSLKWIEVAWKDKEPLDQVKVSFNFQRLNDDDTAVQLKLTPSAGSEGRGLLLSGARMMTGGGI